MTVRTSSLRGGVISGLAATATSTLLRLSLLPVYLKLLGAEGFGLVGVYSALAGAFAWLDFGFSTTVNRELAAADGEHDEGSRLVSALELPYWAVGVAVGVLIVVAAPAIGTRWVHRGDIAQSDVVLSIALMGVAFAFQWPDSFYAGALQGLHRIVTLNYVRIGMSTFQNVGAVLLLYFGSRTAHAYFAWQAATFAIQTVALGAFVRRVLPAPSDGASGRLEVIKRHVRFTAGVTGIAVLSTVFMQLDKIILSRQLALREFGYYTLAGGIAGVLLLVASPIMAAGFPKLSAAVASQDQEHLARLYHELCQILASIVIPCWAALMLFTRPLLRLYLRDAAAADAVAPILRLLATGSALNALVTIPFVVQLAHKWTSLSLYKNLIAVGPYVVLLWVAAAKAGALGAGVMWIVINGAYVVLEIPVMHRRILRGEWAYWYLWDALVPTAVVVMIMALARGVSEQMTFSLMGQAVCASAGALAGALACAAALPAIRPAARRALGRMLGAFAQSEK